MKLLDLFHDTIIKQMSNIISDQIVSLLVLHSGCYTTLKKVTQKRKDKI
jgi:hypothetical protein